MGELKEMKKSKNCIIFESLLTFGGGKNSVKDSSETVCGYLMYLKCGVNIDNIIVLMSNYQGIEIVP